MDHYTITKKSLSIARYHWGLLRTIAVGSMFTIVLHPEHWETVVKVCAPEDFVPDMDGFTDETRTLYRVALAPGEPGDADDLYIVFTKMNGSTPVATIRIGVYEFAEVLDVEDELAEDGARLTAALTCPGCGSAPGDGLTATCFHPRGCGFFKSVQNQ